MYKHPLMGDDDDDDDDDDENNHDGGDDDDLTRSGLYPAFSTKLVP
jgi:hypothetical protein